MELISGKEISGQIYEEIKERLAKIEGDKPNLVVILVGDDPASQVYVGMKEKKTKELGMRGQVFRLPAETTQEELHEKIQELNADPDVNGILLQLPLPKHLDAKKAIEHISPDKDVDGLHYVNVGKLHLGEDCFIPCTPYGIIQMLERKGVEIEGKHAVVIGRSNLVGKPIARLLEQRNATVSICHSRTKNLEKFTLDADILVVAVGRPQVIKANQVKEGAVVIDVGINRVDGKLVGDVDFNSVKEKASMITPVPGGVGPMTICMLMYNTVRAYDIQRN